MRVPQNETKIFTTDTCTLEQNVSRVEQTLPHSTSARHDASTFLPRRARRARFSSSLAVHRGMSCAAAASFHRRTRKSRDSTLGSPNHEEPNLVVPASPASLSHSCTAPYLTDAFARESQPRLRETEQSCPGDSFAFNDTVDTLWYDRKGNACDPDPVFRCANVTSSNENTCSESVCPSGCVSPEASTKCTCDPCGGPFPGEALSDEAHCTGAATCGTFHSDQMLWATKETHEQVELYARDQEKFFDDYAIAHVRMAHIGCEACGLGTDPNVDPCALPAAQEHASHWRG